MKKKLKCLLKTEPRNNNKKDSNRSDDRLTDWIWKGDLYK